MKKGDKVYITKYLLSKGILVETFDHPSDSGYIFTEENPYNCYTKREAYATLAAAKRRGLEMIATKRKSIQKQLAKLDKLEAEMQ